MDNIKPQSSPASIGRLTPSSDSSHADKSGPDLIKLFPEAPSETPAPLSTRKVTLRTEDDKVFRQNWTYLTRHLDNIDAILEKLPHREEVENLICEAWEKGDVASAFLQDPSPDSRLAKPYPYYALAAVKDGKLSVSQFATLMGFWDLRQSTPLRDIQVINIFQQEYINPAAEAHLAYSFRNDENSKNPKKWGDFSEAERKVFFTALQQLPPSERRYFVIPETTWSDPQADKATRAERTPVDEFLYNVQRFRRLLIPSPGQRMIVSLGVKQAYVNAKLGAEEALQLLPAIGEVTRTDIRDTTEKGYRIVGVAFPSQPLPKSADGFVTPRGYNFDYHDFYHAVVGSNIPPDHRKAFVLIDKGIQSYLTKQPHWAKNKLLNVFADMAIDMEGSLYRYKFHMDGRVFWKSLIDSWEAAPHRAVDLEGIRESGEQDSFVRAQMAELTKEPVLYECFKEAFTLHGPDLIRLGITVKPLLEEAERVGAGGLEERRAFLQVGLEADVSRLSLVSEMARAWNDVANHPK